MKTDNLMLEISLQEKTTAKRLEKDGIYDHTFDRKLMPLRLLITSTRIFS
jgi:hypothetical protein